MSEVLKAFREKMRSLIEKAVEVSSMEYFDDDRNDADSYWCSFAYETV